MAKTKEQLKIKERRTFSEEFKRNQVKNIVDKRITIRELSKDYGVSRTAIYKWLYRYSIHYSQKTILVVQMESEEQKTKYYKQRTSDLERVVGQKQLEIDFLSKLLEVASEELGFDIKKNFSTKLLNGTETKNQNTDTK